MSDTGQHASGDLVFYFGEREVFRMKSNVLTNDIRFLTTANPLHGATHVLLPPAPPVVGHWVIGNALRGDLTIAMHRRPRWLTRWAMRVVFDIHWRDA